MALGIPNKLIVLGILALAFFVPKRAEAAGSAVRSVSESISGSLTALGSTRIEPVLNPSLGFGGNIGESIVSRVFGAVDDPTGDPVTVTTVDPVTVVEEETFQEALAEAQDPFYEP